MAPAWSHLNARERRKQRIGTGVIPKRLADVCVPVHVARTEYEAAAKLERIGPQPVLPVSCRASTSAGLGVVAAKKVQDVGGTQSGRSICGPVFVH